MPRGDMTLTSGLTRHFFISQKNGAADFFAFGVTFISVVRLIFSKRINLNTYLNQL